MEQQNCQEETTNSEYPFLDRESAIDDAEVQDDFWSIQDDFIYRHHTEPRVQHPVPMEATFPIPSPPVGTWNPGNLSSSDPTPEEPLRRGGAQGGSGSSPPNWIPNSGVQGVPVQSDDAVNSDHSSNTRCRTTRTPYLRVRLRSP